MTKNMENMRSEVFRAIFNCFPEEYVKALWVGGIELDDFVNEILVEFIKYAFDNSQEKHPLRYYIPYGVDENSDERMVYSRMLAYCQKYRDIEYSEIGGASDAFEELKAKSMQSMEEKKDGYDLTPTKFFEMKTLHDMAALKAFVEKRLQDVKKVPNKVFTEMMDEYDEYLEDWSEKRKKSDYDMVFYSLAFFTIDWKYGFELEYLISKKMEQLKVKDLDRNYYSILFARLTIQSMLGCQASLDSRMIKARQGMVDVLIPDDLVITDEVEFDKQIFAEYLVVIAQLNNGIRLNNGQTLRQWFADHTSMEDWASFFREYDIFKAWHKKELNNTRIRNMRNVMEQIHK